MFANWLSLTGELISCSGFQKGMRWDGQWLPDIEYFVLVVLMGRHFIHLNSFKLRNEVRQLCCVKLVIRECIFYSYSASKIRLIAFDRASDRIHLKASKAQISDYQFEKAGILPVLARGLEF